MPDQQKENRNKKDGDSDVSKKTAEHQLDNELQSGEKQEETKQNAPQSQPSKELANDVERQLEQSIQKRSAELNGAKAPAADATEPAQERAPGNVENAIAENEEDLESALDEAFASADTNKKVRAPIEAKKAGSGAMPNAKVPAGKADRPDPQPNKPAQSAPQPDTETPAQPKPKAEHVEENGVIRRLRTYKDDIARALKKQKASVTSIASAEQKRRAKREAPAETAAQKSAPSRALRIAAVSLVAVALAGAGGAYLWFSDGNMMGSGSLALPEYIRVNDAREFPLSDSASGSALLTALNEEKEQVQMSLGNVLHLHITETTETGERTLVTPQAFFRAINADAPARLTRTFGETFVLGVHAFDGNQPFLLIPIDSYQIAFSEMLNWEGDTNGALAPLFGEDIGRFSVPPGSDAPPERRAYEDIVVQNNDARVLYDDAGGVALLYAFPGANFLLITTNTQTFIEVLNRLRSTRVIQTNQ